MDSSDMVVQLCTRCEGLGAVLAGVRKCPWKVDVFHMFPQVAPVLANFPTYSASVGLGPILHYVLIQLLVSSCKQQA